MNEIDRKDLTAELIYSIFQGSRLDRNTGLLRLVFYNTDNTVKATKDIETTRCWDSDDRGLFLNLKYSHIKEVEAVLRRIIETCIPLINDDSNKLKFGNRLG